MMKKEAGTVEYKDVWQDYQRGVEFNNQIGLYETVENNENFFIGKQWEGVQSNGMPTPVLNFLKRVILFRVSSIVGDKIKMQASPMCDSGPYTSLGLEDIANPVNRQFDNIFERIKINCILREFIRNASVDGDGCTYTYFDPDVDTGSLEKGDIVTEIVENTRVIFGNPNDRHVQKQPWIIIARRELIDDVKARVLKHGGDPDSVHPDTDDTGDYHDRLTDDKCTVLLKFWKEAYTEKSTDRFGIVRAEVRNRIMACECTQDAMIRDLWDTGLTLYPITWMSMEYIHNCYHGQADVTGLIPNQIYVNKMQALAQLSTMTTAFPKVIFDKTRIANWDNRVGAAIGVNGGDVASVARIIEPAAMSPQVAQFIQMTIALTKDFMGATDAALGSANPYNTSALITQQKATLVPLEMVKINLYQSIEDLGRIYMDQMAAYYGTRQAETVDKQTGKTVMLPFDFTVLRQVPMSLKLDVGASAYWSEIASVQTLENLHASGEISTIQLLERLPTGLIPRQQELIDEIRQSDEAKAKLAQLQAQIASIEEKIRSAGMKQGVPAQGTAGETPVGNTGAAPTSQQAIEAMRAAAGRAGGAG